MGQMAFPWLRTGGDPNYFATWDDPPSTRCVKEPSAFIFGSQNQLWGPEPWKSKGLLGRPKKGCYY